MVRDINGLGGYSGPKTLVEQGGKKSADSPTAAPASADSSNAADSDDVQLSSEVKTLQSMADKINSLPDANIERAENIKAALENGDYKVDDLVLADKIINSGALF
ncbi:MAG: flagellar biosynthesis anti-sigma factor FlgM [Oceanicoccus sp.]|uniref:flagellar biosynthesis anti-sigma factor FlgM n=1 Tax=Oceanicoccus sp. TaxID=2691044 RepID=UPI002637699D|nr:flagellar biosynthesis anti-sigma factor FlgM [Oceanicoccus sp.]MCP3907525.1 flagellar biosynthesis anti-sigma factor FlgM [Oceanicoccus sp.]MDG1772857.1 flagellar biosynthesis anti-sigma factor FlgM [Oceanicoccus sp.]